MMNELSNEKLKEILNRWLFLIKPYVKKTGVNFIDDENPKPFFLKAVLYYIKSQKIKEQLAQPQALTNLYLNILLAESNDSYLKRNLNSLINTKNHEEVCYFLGACIYSNYDIEKIVNFLFNYSTEKKEAIKIWIAEKERYNALNVLLGNVLSHLNLLDNTLKDKLDLIFSGIVVNAFHFVSTEKIKDFAEINYKDFYKLDKDSLEQLFLEYLDYIKAPQDWYEKFSYLRENNFIKYLNNKSLNNDDSCYYVDKSDKKGKLKIDNADTIIGFTNLAHEFAHYVAESSGNSVVLIRELPSIYFEKMACKFLIDKGFDKDKISKIAANRGYTNFLTYLKISDILFKLKVYATNGKITKEDFTAPIELCLKLKKAENDSTTNNNEGYILEASKLADEKCDKMNQTIIENDVLILAGINYLVATIIVEELLTRPDTETIPQMLIITNSFYDYNFKKILDSLNIQFFNTDVEKLKLLKK